MSKKVLALVLALVMVLGSFSFVSAADYSDVEGTVYEEAVARLSLLEVLTGYPDGSFKPENTITRAEFAAVAVRAKGLANAAEASKGLPTGFTDVPTSHWASGIVGTAAKTGVVNGIGNGLFAPEAPVKYEEAITMLVRALGYEAAAQTKGGYPYGYLIVANEIGLLDEVKGTQGAPASRGIVAQMTDNALEIPLMIQVGFGADAKFVVSGSKEHGDDAEEQYLLDSMGFDSVKGRVISVNTKTDKLVVDPTKEELKNVTLEVEEGFDFYEVEGLETKFWYKDDVVVVYAVQEEAKFDAVEVDKDEITLITEDENYEVARNATLTVDGKSVKQEKFEADYAKIVLNDDDEIIWAQGYTFDGFILVEEVKDETAYSYDDFDEVDLEDFTIVKEGKTIGIDGIEEEDILFYNNDEEFAVVYNKGTEGELDRVYDNGNFRFEGEAYDLSERVVPVYFDEGKIGELNADILDEFLDDEATITVFVDYYGDVVVVSGEVSSVGNSSYAALTNDVVKYNGRKGEMIALDVRNGADEKVSFDLLVKDMEELEEDGDLTRITVEQLKELKKADNKVLKISVDKDGDVTSIEVPEFVELEKDFKIDDSNAKGKDGFSYRLQSNTIVFHDSNKKATTLGNAKDKFSEVEAGATIFYEKGRVVAVIGETDADTDTKDVTGLVTRVKTLTNGKTEFTVEVLGETQRLVTEKKDTIKETVKEDTIRTFEVGETSGKIKGIKDAAEYPRKDTITIDGKLSGRTITTKDGNKVELNTKAVIYDATDDYEELNLRDLKDGMTVDVYFQGSSKRFVDYVIVDEAKDGETEVATDGTVTYIDAVGGYVIVDGDEIEIIGSAKEFFVNGAIDVNDKIAFELTSGGKMFKITAFDGNLTLDAADNYSTFADLVVSGNLVISTSGDGTLANPYGTVTASNVTVKGNLTVDANATLNATHFTVEGDTTINGNATFKNVTIGGDLDVTAGTATFEKNVKVAGDITGTANITVPATADAATKSLVEDAIEKEAFELEATIFNKHIVSGVLGYNTAFKLSGLKNVDGEITQAEVSSIEVSLYKGTTLLQDTYWTGKTIEQYGGSNGVFSVPFDVNGTFDYETDGYWIVGTSMHGNSAIPDKVVAKVVLVNGKVLEIEYTTFSGDYEGIYFD